MLLALLSLLSNVVTVTELEGRAQGWSFVRKTISALLNTGTLWAALAVWVGRLHRSWWTACLAAVLALESTLVLHYGLGHLLGVYDASIWAANSYWFIAGVILCAPLGGIGWLSRRTDWPGLAAALVVPVGALAETFVTGKFSQPSFLPWPTYYATLTAGVVLLVAGTLGVLLVLRDRRNLRPQQDSNPRPTG